MMLDSRRPFSGPFTTKLLNMYTPGAKVAPAAGTVYVPFHVVADGLGELPCDIGAI